MSAARSVRALSPTPRAVFASPVTPKCKLFSNTSPLTPTKNNICKPPSVYLTPGDYNSSKRLFASSTKTSPVSTTVHAKCSRSSSTDNSELIQEFLTVLDESTSPFTLESPQTLRAKNKLNSSPFSSPLYTPNLNTDFLGRGTFGNVTLCRYQNHKFALKIVRLSTAYVGERNFLGLQHDHLVKILRISEVLDRIFICMEFAGYVNLLQVLEIKGHIDVQKRVSFAHQVASGLNHCHEKRIIHGDIKPANVMVSPGGHCKLGDFGFSKTVVSEGESFHKDKETSYVTGTAAYAAPEVLKYKFYTTAADIYSFGITLWQIYTCELPFDGIHPHSIIYRVVKQYERPIFKGNKTKSLQSYIDLARSCWMHNSYMRPSSKDVLQRLENIYLMLKNMPFCS